MRNISYVRFRLHVSFACKIYVRDEVKEKGSFRDPRNYRYLHLLYVITTSGQ